MVCVNAWRDTDGDGQRRERKGRGEESFPRVIDPGDPVSGVVACAHARCPFTVTVYVIAVRARDY